MIYCFDIDGTLNYIKGSDYKYYQPNEKVIALLNKLYDEGHTIKLFTSRGVKSGKDWKTFTEQQLLAWGVKYHELIMGKADADLYIDDKAVNVHNFPIKKNLIMLIGEKASGKTFVRNEFQKIGYYPVSNEDKYIEFATLYPDKDINSESKMQDMIYKDIFVRLMQNILTRDVVYEATGANKRWAILKHNLSSFCNVAVVKVVSDYDRIKKRLSERTWQDNYYNSPSQIISISDNIPESYDFLIHNDENRDISLDVLKIDAHSKKQKVVAVSGGFDPVHIGHIRLFENARSLGGRLLVLLNSDEFLLKKKGYIFMPFEERKTVIESIRYVDKVIPVIDNDNTVRQTLRNVRPDVFAIGGDRKGNTHRGVCSQIGCEVLNAIGGDKIQSSSKLVAELKNGVDRKV